VIIAIDGPAGSGKSTVCKRVARRLNLFYLDTGAMYRALTYSALRQDVDLTDKGRLVNLANDINIDLKASKSGEQIIYVNGVDVTKEIRLPYVTNNVKFIAKIPGVRHRLVELQRKIAHDKDVILEGRDTTTVVFPRADFKFYLDADQKERARRRFIELQEKGVSVAFEEILEEQIKRDESDINRSVSPLKKARGVIVVDTTGLTISDVVEVIINYVKKFSSDWNLWYAFMQLVSVIITALFFKLRTYGRENIPKRGGFIIATNHSSHLDPIIAGSRCPRQLHYFARLSLFSNKMFGWLIRSVNAHPIRRAGADKHALSLAEKLLKEGKGIVIFPEATRTRDGNLQKAKPGIGFIIGRVDCPVIPAYIHNTFKAMPRGSKWFKSVPVTVTYGKPIYFSFDDNVNIKKRNESYQKIADQVMDEIGQLKRKQCNA